MPHQYPSVWSATFRNGKHTHMIHHLRKLSADVQLHKQDISGSPINICKKFDGSFTFVVFFFFFHFLKSFLFYSILFWVGFEWQGKGRVKPRKEKKILRERHCASSSRLVENIFPDEVGSLIPFCSLICKHGLSERVLERGRGRRWSRDIAWLPGCRLAVAQWQKKPCPSSSGPI